MAGVLMCAVACVSGCGRQMPEVPEEACEVRVDKSALMPLLPEGEQADVLRVGEDGKYSGGNCSVYVDDTEVLELMHHDQLGNFEQNRPLQQSGEARTFKGNMELNRIHASAEAPCPGKKRGVSVLVAFSSQVMVDDEKWEKLEPEARPHMEAFLNSYMHGLLKHYNCA